MQMIVIKVATVPGEFGYTAEVMDGETGETVCQLNGADHLRNVATGEDFIAVYLGERTVTAEA